MNLHVTRILFSTYMLHAFRLHLVTHSLNIPHLPLGNLATPLTNPQQLQSAQKGQRTLKREEPECAASWVLPDLRISGGHR